MPDNLAFILDRLKLLQRDLVAALIKHDGLPAGAVLKHVAELECGSALKRDPAINFANPLFNLIKS